MPTPRPTTDQAQTLLQTRPDLVAQLRQRFASSGLTREQVHARLRAEGYPEDLLDAYLPGMGATTPPPLTSDVFSAVRALGIADSADIAALQDVHGTVDYGSLTQPCYVQTPGGQISIVTPVTVPPSGNTRNGQPNASQQNPGDTAQYGQQGQGGQSGQQGQVQPGGQVNQAPPAGQTGQQNPYGQSGPTGQTGPAGTYTQPMQTTPPSLYGQPIRPCDDSRTPPGQRLRDPRMETMLLERDSLDRVGALVDSGF